MLPPTWVQVALLYGSAFVLALLIERLPRPWTRGPLFVGASVIGFAFSLWLFTTYGPSHGGGAFDIYAYWDVRLDDLYGRSLGQLNGFGAFRYTPPMAFILAPLHLLPLALVIYVWTAALFVVLVWLAGRYSLAVLAYPGIALSIYEGNIDLLLAAVIVLGFRYPAAWSVAVLTKVTPGIGLLWFAVRREWRPLAIALGASAAIALPTLLLRSDLWAAWLAMVSDNSVAAPQDIPLSVRLLIAAAMIVWAARTDRPWVLGFAIGIAQPTLVLRSFATIAASVALARRSIGRSDSDRSTADWDPISSTVAWLRGRFSRILAPRAGTGR